MKHSNFLKNLMILAVLLATGATISCTEDDGMTDLEDPIASFQFEVNTEDFLQVTFSNFSQNATSYSWDFGDASDANTEESPVYTYGEAGSYTVTLTATNDDGESVEKSETVLITDPLAAQRTLVGDNGKSWRLLADVSGGEYPIEVGPTDRSQIWFAVGLNEDVCVRECIFDDTWTFNTDGTYDYENNGDFFGENGIWPDDVEGSCFDTSAAGAYTGKDGQDLSAWNSGTHDFEYNSTTSILTITGGFIGLSKVGTSAEHTEPQTSVTYKVIKLVDADVDTLVLETELTDAGGYWSFALVSYDNESTIVEVAECPEVTMVDVTVKVNMNDYSDAFTTPEVNATWNNWCGNCNAMSDDDGDGIWETVVTIAANTDFEYKFSFDSWTGQEALTEGSSCTMTTDGNTNRTLTTAEENITLDVVCWNSCDNCPSNAALSDVTDKAWKLSEGPGAIRVGPGIGSGEWFTSDQAWADSKSCLFDDSFTFSDAGTFTINIGDQMFAEASMTGVEADACVDIASVPSNLTDWTGGTFDFTFVEASETDLATITVTGSGAYIGFFKGASGAELTEPVAGTITYEILSYTDGASIDVLEVTVDISANQDGTAYWTYKLVSE